MTRFFCSICCILFSVAGLAQQDDSLLIRRIADTILTDGKAYGDLTTLTKNVGGRLSGSPQMVKAEQWGQAALHEAGADKVWLQQCMVPHWTRGAKEEAKFMVQDKNPETLDILALGNSVGTGAPG